MCGTLLSVKLNMPRSALLLWIAIGLVSCEGRRSIRLLEPDGTSEAGAGSVLGSSGVSSGGGGTASNSALREGIGGANNAGASGAVALPNSVIIFRNLMIIKTTVQVAGQSWQLDNEAVKKPDGSIYGDLSRAS